MNIEQVREYTLSLLGVTEDQAFGDDILNFRLEGKIFVCLWLGGGRYDMKEGVSRIALKLSPDRNIELREQFSAALEQDALERCLLRRNGRSNSNGVDQRVLPTHCIETSKGYSLKVFVCIRLI